MRFELATCMTVDKQFIQYAPNSPCDWLCAFNISDVIKCMYYSKNSELKITLLLVNIIVKAECQKSQNNAVEL